MATAAMPASRSGPPAAVPLRSRMTAITTAIPPARMSSSESGSGCQGAGGRSPNVLMGETGGRGAVLDPRPRRGETTPFARDAGCPAGEVDCSRETDLDVSPAAEALGRGLRERPRGPLVLLATTTVYVGVSLTF